MNLKEYIEDKLSNNSVSYAKPDAESIMDIITYADVLTDMDMKTQDYFYKISIEELVSNNAPEELIDDLSDAGWSLDEEHKYIIIFLTN